MDTLGSLPRTQEARAWLTTQEAVAMLKTQEARALLRTQEAITLLRTQEPGVEVGCRLVRPLRFFCTWQPPPHIHNSMDERQP